MIPAERFRAENQYRDDRKNNQADYFLNYFQLYQCKLSSIAFVTNSVGRHLTAVFKKSDSPTD
jgi:hypothetical protein